MKRAIIACILLFSTNAWTQDINNPQTNATALSNGSLNCARTPALTGDTTTSAGSCATTVAKIGGNTPPTGLWKNNPPVAAVAGTDYTAPGVVLQANAGSSATASLTDVMGGAGSVCTMTPTRCSRVFVIFEGAAQNNTANDAISFHLRFGTGTAPALGVAVVGTQVGNAHSAGGGAGNANVGFPTSIGGIVTGLTPGTAYWFDVALHAIVGGTATLGALDCSGFEF